MSTNPANAPAPEMVNLIIDGKAVRVPKGTNLIEAAKTAGIEIPYYCYHPHLTVVGNCRMCQVKIKGAPKMDIACNTMVREGMEVQTHFTSKEVEDSQAATLEFILINHPLDCTVCDQAGHCKLQDYHYEYNARPSRFLEEKEHKVKAEPLGPTVMLDGERCILCTRCIRFCDEVTGTSELGMLNRGDRSVIAINPGRELNNPLSGTVVDLCPVGALTHRKWRFNTRIWFTKETNSICPGCSTGCNTKVAVRDREVVQVKGRLNSEVNKEWMCDEGRYGHHRYLPQQRLVRPILNGQPTSWDTAFAESRRLAGAETLVFLTTELLTEEYDLIKKFLDRIVKNHKVVTSYWERSLTPVEKILISPDYAPNFRGFQFAGLGGGNLEASYNEALARLRSGSAKSVILVGDRAIAPKDLDEPTLAAIRNAEFSLATVCDAHSPLVQAAKVVLPARSILEKSGLLINRKFRLQYNDRVIDFPQGSEPDWRIFNRLAERLGGAVVTGSAGTEISDRELTLTYLAGESKLAGVTIPMVKAGGVQLTAFESSPDQNQGAYEAKGA